MILDLMRDGLSIDLIVNLMVRVFVIFCVLPIHEFAHALVAQKLGDETARLSGRLTTNPLAHIDPLGALMILLAGFGYAKAVPVNMNNFKRGKRKKHMAIVALAGPASNLIMAFLFMVGYCAVVAFGGPFDSGSMPYYIATFLSLAAQINISLAVFNLLPIPPLDGSRILSVAIPDKYYYKVMQYERYIVLVVFALILTGALNVPMDFLSTVITDLLFKIASFPFKFII